MMKKYRIGASLITLTAIIFLPYWVYLPLLLAVMIVFPLFLEGIVLAFLIDVLYGRGVGGIAELFSPMAFFATLVLILLLPIRERLRV